MLKLRINLSLGLVLLASLLPCWVQAAAVEYKSVAVAKATLYDAPSAQAKKQYLLGQGYPVEVIVNLGDWLKVRDALGTLSWVDAKQLSNNRSLLTIQTPVEVHQAADAASPLLAKLDKDLILDWVEPAKNGWIKVKHRDGVQGYVSVSAVWGW